MFKTRLLNLAAATALVIPGLAGAAEPQTQQMREHGAEKHKQMESPGKSKPTGQYGGAETSLPKSEQAFLVDAAVSNLTEVKLGELAEQQSANQAVKELAHTLVNDHQKANDQLQKIFTDQQIAFPQTVSGKHVQTFEKLSQTPKASFDRQFVAEIIEEHKRDVKSYQAWQKKAEQPAVKDYLEQTLPKLQDHLKTAQQVAKQLRSGKTS